MPRDTRAYVKDVIDACDAIAAAVEDIHLDQYRSSRLIRSAVKREFILIGDTVVWGVIERNLTTLRSECAALLSEFDHEHGYR